MLLALLNLDCEVCKYSKEADVY